MKSGFNRCAFSISVAVAFFVANVAFADPRTDVKRCFDKMRLEIRQGWVGNSVYVDIESFDARAAYCAVEFKNGPERRTRKATIDPDESKTITFSPKREVIRMRITVRCAGDQDRLKNKAEIDESCRTGPLQLTGDLPKQPQKAL